MTPRSLLAAAACCACLPSAAILIRADRDDAEYLELATRYRSSVFLAAPEGEGVLIAPRWVLTAAHVAKVLQEAKPAPRLRIGAREYGIAQVISHPDWMQGGPSDLALLHLDAAVPDVPPTPLYRATDESGRTAIRVGSGYTGKIGEKPVREQWDRKKRAAINTVDRVAPRTLGLKIKPPDEASDLQGAAAPGDAGGPLYFETSNGLFVAGIGYATDDANADGVLGNAGDWELYVRVSTFIDWIEAAMLEVAKREAEKLLRE